MEMTPPHAHINLDELFSAGMFAICTVGEPGAQGAVVTGTQGMGVNTPNLAAVAAATCGLASELHMPKGMILTMGLLSMMLAMGVLVVTRFTGSTLSVLGVVPKLHCNCAPPQQICPIEAHL